MVPWPDRGGAEASPGRLRSRGGAAVSVFAGKSGALRLFLGNPGAAKLVKPALDDGPFAGGQPPFDGLFGGLAPPPPSPADQDVHQPRDEADARENKPMQHIHFRRAQGARLKPCDALGKGDSQSAGRSSGRATPLSTPIMGFVANLVVGWPNDLLVKDS